MKSIHRIAYLFLVFGLAGLAVAAYLGGETRSFIGTAHRAQGVVVELVRRASSDGATYAPRVRFADDREAEYEFVSSVSSNPPSFSPGQRVEVLYDPATPQAAKIDSFGQLWGGSLVAGILGCMLTMVGGGMLLAKRIARQRTEELKATGRPIIADYLQVEVNTSLKVNGRHPFRVLAQWQDPVTKKIHVFKSENLWFNPEPYLDRRQLTVYVGRDNFKRHHVDLSFLPELADG